MKDAALSQSRFRTCEAMGTRFEVFLHGQDAEHLDAVAVAVIEEFVRLDSVLSRFDPRSEIARVNREASGRAVRVDRELFALLEKCEQARRKTAGYFDVARGASVVLDEKYCTVQFTNADAEIDLGAVGKGYALDCGREILLRYGVSSGLLQGGTSSVWAIGNESWPVDLRHPLSPELIVSRIELNDCALSCSAVRQTGQQQSDVTNPHTGKPLTGDAACVVLAASATEAEFFSTGLLAMGRKRAEHFLTAYADLEITAGWIEADGSVHWFGSR